MATFTGQLNTNLIFASMYNMIFDENFKIYTMANAFFDNYLNINDINGFDIVLDLSSLILLCEISKKYSYAPTTCFVIPISLQSLLKETLIKEEISTPSLVYEKVIGKLSIQFNNKSKSPLWNIITDLLNWIDKYCEVAIVEDKLNYSNVDTNKRPIMSVEMDSILLALQGKLLLTEDWYWTKTMLNAFPSMSVYNWLHVTNVACENEYAELMIDCGNLGYNIPASYIMEQYKLQKNHLPNRFSACMENVEVNPTNYQEIIDACKLIINDSELLDVSKVIDMLVCALKHIPLKAAYILCYRESINTSNEVYLKCLGDALKVAHPTIFKA